MIHHNLSFTKLRPFLILWATQSLSSLGSAMTSFALVIWSYEQQGSALSTALLSVCSYAPYVIMSIFSGALSDRWNKKYTMLLCDTFAACSTLAVLLLLCTDSLAVWHLYLLNALNGLMNTVQSPASDVAVTLLTPREQIQRVSALQSLSGSLVTVLTPAIAAVLLTFGGMFLVIILDLLSFAAAFTALLLFIKIPAGQEHAAVREPLTASVRGGLQYLKDNRGILDLILFLAAINLIASMYNAALPAMLLSRQNGGETVLGLVSTVTGLATLAGSIIVSFTDAPKNRSRVICNTLLFSMSTENLLLAVGRTPLIWCVGAVLGWLFIPVMNTNMNALLRSYIPVEMQGRVYSARNSLQFFTIPVGYLLGGFLIDNVLELFMAVQTSDSFFCALLGTGKGTGAALLFLLLSVSGILVCICFRFDRYIKNLESNK